MSDPNNKRIPWLKILIVLGLLAILIGLYRFIPFDQYLAKAIAWVESLGPWAPIAFIGIYTIAAILFIPGSLLTLFAGTFFGIISGTIYVSIGSTLGATLAFLIGRHLARNWVEGKITGHPKFKAIDSAVAQEGWKIVGLTRLSPIFPFNLLNYAYGLTKVKFTHYVLASWIGMLPGTLLYVYIGSLGKAATQSGSKSPAEWAMYGVGLLATLLVTLFITKTSKKALNAALED